MKQLQNDVDTLKAQAESMGNTDALARTEKAERNLISLEKKLKADASRETLQ